MCCMWRSSCARLICLCQVQYCLWPATLPGMWLLPQAVSLPFLFWIVIAFFSYLPAERDMTIHGLSQFVPGAAKATLGAAISLGLTAFATLIFILLNPSDEPLRVLRCTLSICWRAGLLNLGMNWTERKVKYLVLPSQKRLLRIALKSNWESCRISEHKI